VLKALRCQTLAQDQWELLLVDNRSETPLNSKSLDPFGHPHSRVVREERLGLSWARSRGIEAAATDLLIFVDDDNVLEPDYLSQAIRIGREWPALGVWGSGATFPEFEAEPADNVREFLSMFALREVNCPQWSNVIPCAGARPWGAGQCVRRDVAMAYRRFIPASAIKLTDRQGAKLSGGGDIELCFVACNLGFGVGIFPDLRLTHLIPKERVSENYLVRLAEGSATSSLLLAYKWEGIRPVSPYSGPVAILRVLKNLLMRKGIHRRMYLASLRSRALAHEIIFNNAS
jgi:glycosyltransferase involved in cell wall biosynthesis